MKPFPQFPARLAKYAAVWLKAVSTRGVSAIEYGLLAALIALVIIGGITSLGSNLSAVFTSISTSI